MGNLFSFLRDPFKRKRLPSLTAPLDKASKDEPSTHANKKAKHEDFRGRFVDNICTIDELCSSRLWGSVPKPVRSTYKDVPRIYEVAVEVDFPRPSSPFNYFDKNREFPKHRANQCKSVSQNADGNNIKLFSVKDDNLKHVQISKTESREIWSSEVNDLNASQKPDVVGQSILDLSAEAVVLKEQGGFLTEDFNTSNDRGTIPITLVGSVLQAEHDESGSTSTSWGSDSTSKTEDIFSNENGIDNSASECQNSSETNCKEQTTPPEMEFESNGDWTLKQSRKKKKKGKNQKVQELTKASQKWPESYYCKSNEVDEEVPDASEYFRASVPTGRTKGLQWNSNSCYMDAMLFSMFYSTTIFDPFFETLSFSNSPTDPMAQNVHKILWNNIVKPLRGKNSFVEAYTGTNKLRQALSSINQRMIGSMMDVDELVSILFKRALKLQGFIQYSIGTGNHMHQILFNPKNCPSTDNGFIDVQNLISTSMEFQDLKLASVPVPALIIKMSRSNGSLVFHEGILPNLVLDVSSLMANPEDMESPKCMYLVAVVVLQSHHYTAYVRHGIETSSPWYYFDSMPASVVKCTGLGETISKMEQNLEGLGREYGDLGKVISANHVCIYFSPEALNNRSYSTKL